ncbi:hypothetical protein VitviT2T_016932 [Vitis vinifera]|uniref:Uncharacterized protein n=1 Tax=Vitis vinifera TaxID=29760 RepID=A0ABY9CTE7_VITVI|nr:hypothetical protein VitviT2T_016932 [Vitis vinifera]
MLVYLSLFRLKLPLHFFLINRSPSTAIDKRTTQEVWSGNPASYSYLNIFGCLVYTHVDNGKFELRSIKCLLWQ